jgi:hypothetical protein
MLRRIVLMLSCVLVFGLMTARADEWNKKTVMTFNQPVELPGIVLPAGTYVFKLLDSTSDRHIVQVFNADETKIFATILAIPDYRLTPTDKTVVHFSERPRHLPDAVHEWYYPGDNFGQEFVYPKARAMALAEETKAPVLAANIGPEPRPEELMKLPVETVTPEPAVVVEEPQPQHWAEPEPVPVVAEPEPVPLPPPTPPAPPEELPTTASPIPTIALFGLIALALGGFTGLVIKKL